jgi:hypothetical protein
MAAVAAAFLGRSRKIFHHRRRPLIKLQKIQNNFFYRVNDRVEYLLCRGFLLTQQFFAWKLIGVAPCGEFEKTTKTF